MDEAILLLDRVDMVGVRIYASEKSESESEATGKGSTLELGDRAVGDWGFTGVSKISKSVSVSGVGSTTGSRDDDGSVSFTGCLLAARVTRRELGPAFCDITVGSEN
jgi:hypothetical protein